MGFKTILVHCDAAPEAGRRLALAAGMAQRESAHLVGVHARLEGIAASGNVPADVARHSIVIDPLIDGAMVDRKFLVNVGRRLFYSRWQKRVY